MHNGQEQIANRLPFNPFTEQVAGRYFVGRENQLNQFELHLNGLRNGTSSHMYVAGLHGTGKTSLLDKLSQMATDSGFVSPHPPPSLDATGLDHDHISSILRSILDALELVCANRNPSLSLGWVRDWDQGKDSTFFLHPRSDGIESERIRKDLGVIRSQMRELGIQGAVVCIDEGQRISGSALSTLKNSLQALDGFLLVLSLRLVVNTGSVVDAGRVVLDEKAQQAEGDFGASRFFIAGVPTGPFQSEDEAVWCIRKRLELNPIRFDEETMKTIARISSRVPHFVISISSAVYDYAASRSVHFVQKSLLNEAFKHHYQGKLHEANSLYENSSVHTRMALEGLLALRRPANAEDIAERLSPGMDQATRRYVVDGIQSDLLRLCDLSTFCRRVGDQFEISNAIDAYALELCMEES